MVSYYPKERPSLDEILKSTWLKEVRELKKEEEEDQIKTELNDIYENDIKSTRRELIRIDDKIKSRSVEDNKNLIFKNKDLKPKKISKDRLSINKFIKINGNLNEVNFMNSLIEGIKSKFYKNISIKGLENI